VRLGNAGLVRSSGLRPAVRGLLGRVLPVALFLLLLLPSRPAAHEIPPSVTVFAFVRPEGQRLHLVMRVPLEAMRDLELPLRGPGYLEISRAAPQLRDAAKLWLADYIEMYEGSRRLTAEAIGTVRVSLPSDRSFASYETAVAHLVAPPLPDSTDLPWQQAMLDVAIDYPIASTASKFSIHPRLAHLGLRTTTVLRFQPPGGAERALQYDGDPGLVRLDPRWYQAALRFVTLGFLHILDGIDHLLFVFCLVIPFRRPRPLIAIVTSFTIAHSITLIASALGLAPTGLWFPPLIEMLIALSIVYMAFENIVGARLERRWLLAFGFGLVHGFGFSFILRESVQFAGTHLATSLVAFNIGVELGQLVVLAAAIPALGWLFSRVVAERMGTIVLSALVAHTAWHWMLERWRTLRVYRFTRPAWDAALAIGAMRAAMLVLGIGGVLWAMHAVVQRLVPPKAERGVAADGD
jgi:HupE/UreJ protein